ncbi:MAG: gliding motility-associated C-terminal domain-containing protein, partial [Chitinophaga sp.]
TTTAFGTVNFWDWDFGDVSTQTDYSPMQHPEYTYPSTGQKNVRLITHNSVGCKDTLVQPITVLDKPPIRLAFRDTLICPPDPLQLRADGTGTFTWSPVVNMTGANTATPQVNVTADTKYYVDLDYDGCLNRDSVTIRAVNRVTLALPPDTVICLGDAIMLRPASDGLLYTWTPAASLSNAALKNPLATPTGNTQYVVTASISNCTATDDITVSTVPYPSVDAGPDTVICFDTFATLHAATDGSAYTWSPLLPPTLEPVIRPAASTAYILTATDTRGCPKPSRDTMLVTVLPKVNAFAGRDTAVVLGQPLQLNASGGLQYSWSPAAGLSNPFIPDPVITFHSPTRAIRYRVLVQDEAGCADSAFINVRVYNTMPQVFVPTAFTPNGDGTNDFLRPVAAGILEIKYFSVYNRWGQLVFTSSKNGHGWDGRINGAPQSSGVYVWQVMAVDYLGQDFYLTGTAALLR